MKFLIRIIPVCIFILISCPIFAQLRVKSDFDREAGQLNVEIINKSPYMLMFMTQMLSRPPFVSIESFDSKGNPIEWLRIPPTEHDGPYLFDVMYMYLRRGESYQLSFEIRPDKTKRKPEYFVVTYYLPFDKLNIEKPEGTLAEQSKHFRGFQSYRFKERFEFDPSGDDNPAWD